MPTLDIENYLDFKAMTHYVKAVTSAAPHLARAFSIGKTKAGRPLLVVEVTNRNLREGRHKPGLWVDGGHQGWNLLGSMACLELLRFLVAGHGRDEFLTDLVDHTVFYIAPRLAPDEAEICLASGALVAQQTLDGASELGRQFRLENSLGGWKPFKRDNRVLVPRNPEDRKGPFYDLYRSVDRARILEALPQDFPQPESTTPPLQLPSTRAIFEFMRSYPNVFGAISTSGPGDRLQLVGSTDSSRLKDNLGQRLGELSGLPVAPFDPHLNRPGQFLHWAANSLGVLACDCQMWSMRSAAGIKAGDLEDPFAADENELLQLLRFCEKEFPEGSFTDWSEVDDPSLGEGELGGWDWSKTWLNPPMGPYLGRELKKLSRLTLGLASAAPRLAFGKVEETLVGWSQDQQPLRRVKVQLQNAGYLPTCPLESGKSMDGVISLNLGTNTLLIGQSSTAFEELSGNGQPQQLDGLPRVQPGTHLPTQRQFEREFLISGSGALEITASHPLAGTETCTSRPPQGMRPPAFDPTMAAEMPMEQATVAEDPFDEVFPSFEDLHQEPALPDRGTVPLAPERPQPAAAAVPPAPPPVPVKPHPAQLPPPVDPFGDSPFNIPDPTPAAPLKAPVAKPVTFGKLEETPTEQKQSPFPAQKPSKGRVFGTPPQKPTGGLPAALTGMGTSEPGPVNRSPGQPAKTGDGGFSPLPLVKGESGSSSAFEPMAPPAKSVAKEVDIFGADTITGNKQAAPSPPPELPSFDEQPAAPPPRLSRMSAPQLLRRQRGGQGPNEPFKR